MTINADAFLADLDQLATFTDGGPGVNRIAYSTVDLRARDWIDGVLRDLGCAVRRDSAGNTIALLPGLEEGLKPFAIGSHTDTVPNGGRFDGALGVMAAVACARALSQRGAPLRHPLEVINFMAEEATMSGGTTGSQIMTGRFHPAQFDQLAWDGQLVRDHFRAAGYEPERWRQAVRRPGELTAYLELHIEQGDALERQFVQIGAVEGIVGIRRYRAVFEGHANHAGTTPMDSRKDALVMAAPFVQTVRDAALAHGIVGTVGKFDVHPGAPNVIPGRVEMIVELRALRTDAIDSVSMELLARIQPMGGTMHQVIDKPPTYSDGGLVEAIERACESRGLSHLRMASGAFHDAANMAWLCPQAMLFVPSQGGVSHSPDEHTRTEDCINGANVLLAALIDMDTRTQT